jgi:hypothetical protein
MLVPYLTKLFNKLLENGNLPECRSDGYIIPLLKKGDPDLSDNYQVITLLST